MFRRGHGPCRFRGTNSGDRIDAVQNVLYVLAKRSQNRICAHKSECHIGDHLPLFTPVMRNVSMRRVVAELLKYLYQGIKGDLWSVEPRQDFRS